MQPSHVPMLLQVMFAAFCRALYGLKQVPHAWFECFVYVIWAAGFSPSEHDPGLFIHIHHVGVLCFFYMLIMRDDMDHISSMSNFKCLV
jgi:hypothetical protein